MRACVRFVLLVLSAALALPVHADPPPEPPAASPYGDTYTPAELAALDRALHAGNLTREDLTFRKDMAKGHACLDIVREMLRDPLAIAPFMDRFAAAADGRRVGLSRLWNALDAAHTAFEVGDLTDSFVPSEELGFLPPPEVAKAWPPARTADEALLLLSEIAYGRLPTGLPRSHLDGWFGVVREKPLDHPDALRRRTLRRLLPDEMLMREVVPSPYPANVNQEIAAYAKTRPASHLYDRCCDGIFSFRFDGVVGLWLELVEPLLGEVRTYPRELFPTDRPLVRETAHGRVALGTFRDDVYTGDYAVIVDPGGNDRYERGRFAAAFGAKDREVGLLIDLGGHDVYDCADVDVTLGAACFGLAGLLDLGQGNDRYVAGHLSLGAAVAGIGVLYDDGGSDTYEGKTFTQGAAGFGVGILYDDAVGEPPVQKTDEETKDPIDIAKWDNDRLHAWCCAQAFARTMGVALCINTRGNEVYEAGGVYLHAPLFADRYQSFSQGFAIGAREIDYAGGLAMLIDRAGNDRYLGDVYDQGVGYWYSAGLLWDGGGNDHYEMTQYGQGSGIHLAVGGLVDVSGSDAYVMHSGLGQGGSHDYAASILHDRGGNDRYHGNTSCNGCGLTNSVGLFLDRGGDDTYAARRDGGLNAGRPARGFGSVGLFVDLGGKDDYLGAQTDGWQWRGSDVGLGLDLETASAAPGGSGGGTSAPNQLSGRAEIPAVVKHEGPLTETVFEELWAIACRWEVGDNRVIVPEARKRLVASGKDVLPLLEARMGKEDTGLALRAYVDVLRGLVDAGARAEVVDLLRKGAASSEASRRKTALHLIGELQVKEAESSVVDLLGAHDEHMARRAAGVLQQLGSHAGNEVLARWLDPATSEPRLLAALGTLLGQDADVYARVRPLLAHPLVTVRTRLATLLAERRAAYGGAVVADLGATDLSERARRTLLDAVARGPIPPDADAVARVAALLTHADWGVRADAARVSSTWLAAQDADAALLKPAAEALAALRATEQDPFVRAQLPPPEPPRAVPAAR